MVPDGSMGVTRNSGTPSLSSMMTLRLVKDMSIGSMAPVAFIRLSVKASFASAAASFSTGTVKLADACPGWKVSVPVGKTLPLKSD